MLPIKPISMAASTAGDSLNGAAARQVEVGDHVILMCYAQMTPEEAKEHHPKVVFVDDENKIARVTNYEKHGKLTEDFI